MIDIEEICADARKVPNTQTAYECVRPLPCAHQIPLFDRKRYCRVPLNPEKYLKDGEIINEQQTT